VPERGGDIGADRAAGTWKPQTNPRAGIHVAPRREIETLTGSGDVDKHRTAYPHE
jgi:hypothetical protein